MITRRTRLLSPDSPTEPSQGHSSTDILLRNLRGNLRKQREHTFLQNSQSFRGVIFKMKSYGKVPDASEVQAGDVFVLRRLKRHFLVRDAEDLARHRVVLTMETNTE